MTAARPAASPLPDGGLVVAHVISGLGVGGAERMLQRLIVGGSGASLLRHHVYSLRDLNTIGAELEDAGIAVETLGLTGMAAAPQAVARLSRRLKRRQPDIVQCWMYHGDLIGGLAARAAGIRNIFWNVRATSLGSRQGVSPVTSVVRRACAALSRHIPARIIYVANSARVLHEGLGYDRRKGIVLPNGYATPGPFDADCLGRVQKEIGAPADAILIGSVGRFTGLKDHATFVAACSQLARANDRVHFVMVGDGLDAANTQLREWIARGGMAERFHLLGRRGDVAPYYAAMDVFCLHSVAEGFPNVVAEAMAVGTPCVVTNVGDAADLVDDTGLVVAPGDPAALSRGLAEMLSFSVERRRMMGYAARKRIADNFSIEAVRARYEQLYLETAGASAHKGELANKPDR